MNLYCLADCAERVEWVARDLYAEFPIKSGARICDVHNPQYIWLF